MPKAKKPHTTTTPSDPPPFNEAWVRLLAAPFGTEEVWTSRDPVNNAMMAVSGAADRLEGLSSICWSLCMAEIKLGANPDAGPRRAYSFLAQTLTDMSKGLRGADNLYRIEMDKADAENLRRERRAGK